MARNLSLVNNLKLKDLMALSVLLELKSVSTAADLLGVAQPNMSRCFSRLREYFQDPLLVRSGKEMLLTVTAEKLQLQLTDLEHIMKAMEPANFDPDAQKMEFIIAVPDYVAQNVLNDVLPQLMMSYEKVCFKLINWNNIAKENLIHGDVHLAVSLDNVFPDNIYRRKIDKDHLVCVARKGHPLGQRSELKLGDMFNFPHVLVSTGGGWIDQVREHLDGLGDLNFRLKVASYGNAFAMIKKTDLITVVPQHVIDNEPQADSLISMPLPFLTKRLEYCFCWHERFHHDPAHKWLREKLFPLVLKHPKQLASKGKVDDDR